MRNDILLPLSIDPKQVQQIEAIHKGFLYHHLYGAACLITAQKNGAQTLIATNDEHIALAWPDKQVYIHIKTHSGQLQWDHIKETIDEFERLRKEHNEGKRPGSALFVIVTNAALDAELTKDIQHKFWPKDIAIKTPHSKEVYAELPPAWLDIMQGVKWCVDHVNEMSLRAVAPEKLIWKLASRIQHAAADDTSNRINAEDVPSLLDHVVVQLQHLPEAPQNYKAQENEPLIQSGSRIRLISGVSGSGKTAWAAQAFQHAPDAGLYLDVSNLPQSAVAGSLARELVAQFLSNNTTGVVSTILNAGSGLDMLKAIDAYFGKENIAVNVFLDNIHLLDIDVIKTLIEASPNVKYILLAQPWPEKTQLETIFEIQAEELKGWSTDTIALEFANAKCSADTETVKRVKSLTLGLPLFVRNAIQLTASVYRGSAKSFCKEIEARSQILPKTFKQLSEHALQLTGILSLVDVPLTRAEVDEISEITIKEKSLVDSALSELSRYGVIEHSINGEVKLHDIFRGLEKEIFQKTPGFVRLRIKQRLADVLLRSMPSNLGRFGLWVRLLAEVDQTDILVDLATFDWFHEMGDPAELKIVLEDASKSSTLSSEDRFWALDALTFWDTQDRLYDRIPQRLQQMEELAKTGSLRTKARIALVMKQMIASGFSGDSSGIESAFSKAVELVENDKSLTRIVEYNRAYAYYHAADYVKVKSAVERLITEYYHHLGLKPSDVMAKGADHILPIVSQIPTWQDDLKRLADCLELLASAKKQLGYKLGLEQIHALKYYTMSQVIPSAIRVGLNVVNQMMRVDPKEARRIIESSILPIVQLPEFAKYQLQVRTQYAAVLAHDGDMEAARLEVEKNKAYAVSQKQKNEIETQALSITKISGKANKKTPRVVSKPKPTPVQQKKVGRNDPCYCGSGLKYKKCHGK